MLFRHIARIAPTVASFDNRLFLRSFSVSISFNMPPKKKEEEKPTPLMGRFGTSLKCGIVGLPNVGCVHMCDLSSLKWVFVYFG